MAAAPRPEPPELHVVPPLRAGYEEILTPAARRFVADLAATFTGQVEALLQHRRQRQEELDAGRPLDFLPETKTIREADWTVASIPRDLLDRRVEITGPVDRKMIINALNSGANVFMADFEDSTTPTWDNLLQGHLNLRDAVAGTITHVDPDSGKRYALHPAVATLLVRPRGWHLWEKHVRCGDRPVPGALFDFGLHFFHNARVLLAKGSGPYFYLPKLQGHLEARLWNDVFVRAQELLGLPRGTIRATCLIETLPAAFEMDEILYELREHSAGLNCGRWDYQFSFIKTLRARPECVMPERGQVTMEVPFMRAYTQLLVKTCHRRGAHAMGGMAAFIPVKTDPARNAAALEQVRQDKLREVRDGHDGTWVAHPGLVPIARAVFDAHLPTPNQIHRRRDDVQVTAADLVRVPAGTRTEAGLRHNLNVGVLYLESWLRGTGCVPIYDLMEDAATAEISRTQVWQWLRHGATLDDGRPITLELFRRLLADEMAKLRALVGEERFARGRFAQARDLFDRLSTAPELEDFLTLPAYDLVTGTTLNAQHPERT
jgi:malate synthase